MMTPVQVLGACGLLSAVMTALAGGLGGSPLLLAAGAVMTFGNIYCIVRKERASQ